jgi:hypothetical protein
LKKQLLVTTENEVHILSKLDGIERLVEDLIHKIQINHHEQIISFADLQTIKSALEEKISKI